MKRLFKILLWLLGIILALLLAVVIFISPIAKYLIEKNSEKYTGRVIRMAQFNINIFTGNVNISGFRMYEPDRKTVFIGFSHLRIDLELRPLLDQVYHIQHLVVDDPDIRITQKGSTFSFDDILKKFIPRDSVKTKPSPSDTVPTKYFLDDILVNGGKFSYANSDFQLDAQLQKLMLRIPQYAWNTKEVCIVYGFLLRSGGKFKGKLNLNLDNLDFSDDLQVDNFNLAVTKPYLTPYLKIKRFDGLLSVDVATRGNFNDPQAIAIKGKGSIYKFSITDEKDKKIIGFKLFSIGFDSLNIKQNQWRFGDILLDEPSFSFELFPQGNNFTQMMVMSADSTSAASQDLAGGAGAASAQFNPFVMLADYVSTLAKQVIITDYRIRRFSITGGEVEFRDHTLNEEFALELKQFFVDVQQINPSKGRATADFSTTINRDGFMSANISINPLDLLDFDLTYELKNVAVVDYNPYSIFHIAYPFKTGKLNYSGTVAVKNHQIKMENKMFVEKIYLGKKVPNNTAMALPVKLALAIMRDKNGNINLVVPVEGDLDNPKFNVWKIIGQVLKNLLVKAVAAPGKLFASVFGGKEEDFKEIPFDLMQHDLTEKQMDKLSDIKKILDEKPELVLDLKQVIDTAKAIEYLAFFEARKAYYYAQVKHSAVPDSVGAEDLTAIDNTDNSGPAFLAYLDNTLNIHDPMVSPLEKCFRLSGYAKIAAMQKERMEKRNNVLRMYLVTKLNVPENRFKISTVTDPKEIPEDKIPRYILNYGVGEE